jgi:hypothetical protein
MAVAQYPTIYRDDHGDEATTIVNDGHTLQIRVRDVLFGGTDLDALEPVEGADSAALASFTLHLDALCACSFTYRVPLPVVTQGVVIPAVLQVLLRLGRPCPVPPGGLDAQELRLELAYGGRSFRSRGQSGWFEDELLEIQAALPTGTYVKACLTCAFSGYSPYGHGLFGDLACFRGTKAEYRAVKSKRDLFRVWGTLTEFVQETYLCPEYERRKPGTGYRG